MAWLICWSVVAVVAVVAVVVAVVADTVGWSLHWLLCSSIGLAWVCSA